MADEQKIAAVEGEKPMTDQELEAMLRKSENVTEFPEVTLDEFTEPSWSALFSPSSAWLFLISVLV